ncbi:MAG: hypothetical protein GY805_05900 [Chloroflexi bacterium]|nr:hypothetical protein [Chloroflexota bacterium]
MSHKGFNGNGRTADSNNFPRFAHELEEPISIKGFSATYDRKFNLGNFESLAATITIWTKSRVPEGKTFDLHHAKERVRHMARENVRTQLLRLQGNNEAHFLGLQPPENDPAVFTEAGCQDPIFVRTVSVSLTYKVNLGDYNSVTPSYTDWADVRHVAHSSGELHIALDRMWQSLWANIEDEISRAQGNGSPNAFFGLPVIEVEDLTTNSQVNGRIHTNGSQPQWTA